MSVVRAVDLGLGSGHQSPGELSRMQSPGCHPQRFWRDWPRVQSGPGDVSAQGIRLKGAV